MRLVCLSVPHVAALTEYAYRCQQFCVERRGLRPANVAIREYFLKGMFVGKMHSSTPYLSFVEELYVFTDHGFTEQMSEEIQAAMLTNKWVRFLRLD